MPKIDRGHGRVAASVFVARFRWRCRRRLDKREGLTKRLKAVQWRLESSLGEVSADVTVTGGHDAKLEKIVTKLGIEPGVFAVSWKIVPTTDEERELVTEV